MKNSFWLFGANLAILTTDSETSQYDLIEGHFPPGAGTLLAKHQIF